MPMDFYFPGKGRSGDLPPRKGFAEKWHPELLRLMPQCGADGFNRRLCESKISGLEGIG